LDRLAEAPLANVREIDGALHRWRGLRGLADEAPEAFAEAWPAEPPKAVRPVTLGDVEQYVLQAYRLTREELHSPRRNRAVALPRQVAMYLMHRNTPASMEVIGEHFGGRDHSTVKHACEKIRGLKDSDAVIRELLQRFGARQPAPA
jgi:chromosomal replication initiator protein